MIDNDMDIPEFREFGAKLEPKKHFETEQDLEDFKREREVSASIVEKQVTYIFFRLSFLEDMDGFTPGDRIEMRYTPNDEVLVAEFASYNKTGFERDKDGNIVTNYNPEDDKKILCLMVDEEDKDSPNIPTLRSMFPGKYYENVFMLKSDLVFTSLKDDQVLNYASVLF